MHGFFYSSSLNFDQSVFLYMRCSEKGEGKGAGEGRGLIVNGRKGAEWVEGGACVQPTSGRAEAVQLTPWFKLLHTDCETVPNTPSSTMAPVIMYAMYVTLRRKINW